MRGVLGRPTGAAHDSRRLPAWHRAFGTVDANVEATTANTIMGEFPMTRRSVLKRGNAQQRKLRAQRARTDRRARRHDALYRRHLERAYRVSGRGMPFRRFAQAVSSAAGRPWAFVLAAALIALWAAAGPIFDFSNRWQLAVNSGTTIATFLMVFWIQNTQNRETEALRLKLDELLLATDAARNEFVGIEDLADEDLRELEDDLKRRSQRGPDSDSNRYSDQ